MNFVKFGKSYINLENVTSIRDLTIDLVGGGSSTGVVRIEFDKDHAIDLVDGYQDVKNWLDAHASNPPGGTVP